MLNIDAYNKWLADLRELVKARKVAKQADMFDLDKFTKNIVENSKEDATVGFMVAFGDLCLGAYNVAFELSRYIDPVVKNTLLDAETKESLEKLVNIINEGDKVFKAALATDAVTSQSHRTFELNKARYEGIVTGLLYEVSSRVSLIKTYIIDENGNKVLECPMYGDSFDELKQMLKVFEIVYTDEKLNALLRELQKKQHVERVNKRDAFAFILEKEGHIVSVDDVEDVKAFSNSIFTVMPGKRIVLKGIAKSSVQSVTNYVAILEVDKKQFVAPWYYKYTVIDLVNFVYNDDGLFLISVYFARHEKESGGLYLIATKKQIEQLAELKFNVTLPNVNVQNLKEQVLEIQKVS